MPKALFKFLRRFDEFGYPIGLNYTSQEEHKTWSGLIFSIIKVSLLLLYFSHILIVLVTRRDPDIQFSSIYRNFNDLTY